MSGVRALPRYVNTGRDNKVEMYSITVVLTTSLRMTSYNSPPAQKHNRHLREWEGRGDII